MHFKAFFVIINYVMSLVQQKVRGIFECEIQRPSYPRSKDGPIQNFFGISAKDFNNFYLNYFERKEPICDLSRTQASPLNTQSRNRYQIFRPIPLNLSNQKSGIDRSDAGKSVIPLTQTKHLRFKFESLRNVNENPGLSKTVLKVKPSYKKSVGFQIKMFLKGTQTSKIKEIQTFRTNRISDSDQKTARVDEPNHYPTNALSRGKRELACKHSSSVSKSGKLLQRRLARNQDSSSDVSMSPPIVSCDSKLSELKHYKMLAPIGKGSYAIVYMAHDPDTGNLCAIKVYSKERMNTEIRRTMLTNEIIVLQSVSHRNIVRLIRVQETSSQVQMITELVIGISMASWSRAFSTPGVPEEIARPILKKLLGALCYLHSKNICHRDIKLENIILTNQFDPKLIDFGFACQDSHDSSLNFFCGTHIYMAPELIKKVPYSGSASDCWAFGVLVYRILTGHFPFSADDSSELNQKICSGKYELSGLLSKEARQAIDALLVVNPSHRVTMKQLRSFNLFN